MKSCSIASRKTVEEDRIAICPNFGCEKIIRVKPLKLGFLGFGKYPKCKIHQIPMVYVDERIVDFVDAALSCLFDISCLPSHDLLSTIKKEIPKETESFIRKWVYCITTGRGAPIISKYIDSISNSYLKQLSKKQLTFLKNDIKSEKIKKFQVIKDGIQEITKQYTRLLKHLKIHHEVFNDLIVLNPPSPKLKKILSDWLEKYKLAEKEIFSFGNTQEISLSKIKTLYDSILNMGICMCVLGYSTKKRENATQKITAFDRFNAYFDFFSNGLTKKFTKSDIEELIMNCNNTVNRIRKVEFKIDEYTEHQKLIINMANVHIPQLIKTLPANALREILIENHIITKRQNVNSTWDELYNMIYENKLEKKLETIIFNYKGKWSWAAQLAKFIDTYKNGIYKFGRSEFTRRMSNQKLKSVPYSEVAFHPTKIEMLFDYFLQIDKMEIDINKRKDILMKIKDYSSNVLGINYLTYKDVQNKPNWILFKALQRVISNKYNRFVSLSEIGQEILGDGSIGLVTKYYFRNDLSKNTLKRIRNYCNQNILNKEDRKFIDSMIIALARFSGIFIIAVEKSFIKYKEHKLVDNLINALGKLKISEGWRSEYPTINELTEFFGIDIEPKLSDRENQLYRVFYPRDFIKISRILNDKLAKIDKKAYSDILTYIRVYQKIDRVNEIKSQYPDYNSYLKRKSLELYGNVNSKHSSDWSKKRDGILGEQVFSLQGFVKKSRNTKNSLTQLEYMFDAFTGNIYRRDKKYKSGRSVWELHHIDFDKTNNDPDNLLWVMKEVNPNLGITSHITNFSNEIEKRNYIGIGMMIKAALKYGYAPRFWSLKQQAEFYEIMPKYDMRTIL